MQRAWPRLLVGLFVLASSEVARAQIEVGPTKQYQELSDVADSLVPGDLVLVDGDASYGPVAFEIDATAEQPITIRGLPVNGKLPLIQGDTRGVELAGDHYVFENFEITGGTMSCLFHHADQIVVRGVIVHDCPNHGILGADDDSGSLLLEYSEIYANGEGTQHHQIYMATDENVYPGSVFRMQHCYVHDSTGGNSLKSRAERNEIYYNWIEGAQYHELELIGPDEDSPDPPDPLAFREDSDVVGNVLRKAGAATDSFVARVGADMLAEAGTNATRGRYRFLNNTILLAADSSSVFRLFGLLESIEMHDNVVWRDGPEPIVLVRESVDEMAWVSGRQLSGSNNWVQGGSSDVDGWSDTLFGSDPAFTDLAAFDITPGESSPLRDAANENPQPPAGFDFPSPLAAPMFLPPQRTLEATGMARLRPVDAARDIGAAEFGEIPVAVGGGGADGGNGGEAAAPVAGDGSGGSSTAGSGPRGGTGGASGGQSSGGNSATPSASASDSQDDGGCGCRAPRSRESSLSGWAALALLGVAGLRGWQRQEPRPEALARAPAARRWRTAWPGRWRAARPRSWCRSRR